MHTKDMISDFAVSLFFDIVGDDKEQVKTGEKGVGESYVLVGIFVDVVL